MAVTVFTRNAIKWFPSSVLRVNRTIVCKLIMSICIRHRYSIKAFRWRHWNLCKSSFLHFARCMTQHPKHSSFNYKIPQNCFEEVIKCYERSDDAPLTHAKHLPSPTLAFALVLNPVILNDIHESFRDKNKFPFQCFCLSSKVFTLTIFDEETISD